MLQNTGVRQKNAQKHGVLTLKPSKSHHFLILVINYSSFKPKKSISSPKLLFSKNTKKIKALFYRIKMRLLPRWNTNFFAVIF
jgi:hypothetical protein